MQKIITPVGYKKSRTKVLLIIKIEVYDFLVDTETLTSLIYMQYISRISLFAQTIFPFCVKTNCSKIQLPNNAMKTSIEV